MALSQEMLLLTAPQQQAPGEKMAMEMRKSTSNEQAVPRMPNPLHLMAYQR